MLEQLISLFSQSDLRDPMTIIEGLFTLGLGSVLGKAIVTILMFIALWVARKTVVRTISNRTEDSAAIYAWRKGSDYVAALIAVILLWNIWLAESGGRSMATYLGLVSAGLAIALQDVITNLIGWVFIITRRPFEVGDRIEIGKYAGDVIDIRMFQFSLLEIRGWVKADQSTGRILHLPNKITFNEGVASYSKGFSYIWEEIPIELTFESDWEKAKKLLQAIVEEHALDLNKAARVKLRETAKRYLIYYDKLTPIIYTDVAPSGVTLTVRYLTEPRQRRALRQLIWEDALRTIAANDDIELAYPTQRIYYHPAEGTASPFDTRSNNQQST